MSTRIAILGGGVMGETLLSTVLSAGHEAADVVVAEQNAERADHLRATHGVEVTDASSAVHGAGVVLVVVKPQDVATVLAEVAPLLADGAMVVSFAAGVRLDTFERILRPGTPVVRVMPNTPALVGEGMFGISSGRSVSEAELAFVTSLLATGGEVVVIDESLQDALTAVSGSGPAYIFYLAEAMVDAGTAAGLDPSVAARLTTQTLIGASKLLAESDVDAAELRRRVTSPNGTTAAAIGVFDERGVKQALVDGMLRAAERSAELSGPSRS
jgi:pyrroline-5-carboxylate reductase